MASSTLFSDQDVDGIFECPDRFIFKGHYSFMYGPWFKNWLFQIGCPLTKYKEFALSLTAEIDDHVRHIAFNNKMNVIYLESAATKRRGLSKDDMARKIALDSKVSTGLHFQNFGGLPDNLTGFQ